ncbi:hypothetical protein DFH07DRAFT_769301 [Mycena maculata]|uniref:Uncharacterized protein n=1 Tax=Mycena maculata TaxID=230809 RepID=A0AAD7IB30_9AGAR|nr:hypothetical protein DFH07DRAFT_778880 [Mycena maculata]KAJ7768084.1 hypothetical protein DFH07DRAFT_769301 [Mycena maculata]
MRMRQGTAAGMCTRAAKQRQDRWGAARGACERAKPREAGVCRRAACRRVRRSSAMGGHACSGGRGAPMKVERPGCEVHAGMLSSGRGGGCAHQRPGRIAACRLVGAGVKCQRLVAELSRGEGRSGALRAVTGAGAHAAAVAGTD